MKHSLKEYLPYISIKLLSRLFTCLPVRAGLGFGRFLGTVAFYLDYKHRRQSYKHLKIAFAKDKTPAQLNRLIKKNLQNIAQDFIELLALPRLNAEYVNKFIVIEGRENLDAALKQGKGAILLGSHEGSWEISNAGFALLGYPVSIVAQTQRHTMLNDLLDSYRVSKGINVVAVNTMMRQIIECFKSNKVVGLSIDHGGTKDGVLIDFFGRQALTPIGAVKFALRFDTPILFGYLRRIKGPYHKLILLAPAQIQKTGDRDEDIRVNLERINRVVESYVRQYPEEYFWYYKRWKGSLQRNVIILSDGKAGHLRQAQAVLKQFKSLKSKVESLTIVIKYKSKFHKTLLNICALFMPGCRTMFRCCLTKETYGQLIHNFADIVISCGSSLAAVNLFLKKECLAKSVAVLRPGIIPLNRFDLVIMPRHDNPSARGNVLITEGALNLISEEYLKEQAELLRHCERPQGAKQSQERDCFVAVAPRNDREMSIGILIGGDTKNYKLTQEAVSRLCSEIKRLDRDILLTTSRRTSKEIEGVIKSEFSDYVRAKLLIIANEKNIPEAVGGILGLSEALIVTPESISMISEAVNSAKYVFVLKPEAGNIDRRHKEFLDIYAQKKYINLVSVNELAGLVKGTLDTRPQVHAPCDNVKVRESLGKIIG